MSTPEYTPKRYICNVCNIIYASRQSLWNHTNKFHYSQILLETPKILPDAPKMLSNTLKILPKKEELNELGGKLCFHPATLLEKSKAFPNNELQCKYCKIIFTRKYNLNRHFITCKEKNIKLDDIKMKEEIREKLREEMREEMKEEIAAMKKELLVLMNKQCKVHPKTLQKINNTLNNNNINNCNNTNTIYNIVQLGNENLENVFSKNKQIEILKQRYCCLPYLIKEAHLNDKYPQFRNILITNLQNNIAYKYDKTTKNFIAVDKSELLNEVVGARMEDIESFFESNTDVLDAKTKDCIETFISKMESREGAYYEDKLKDVKLMIYNNRDKVSKELTQTLEIIV